MSSGSVLVCSVTSSRPPKMPGWTPAKLRWWPSFVRWATPWRAHTWHFTRHEADAAQVAITFTQSARPGMKLTLVGDPQEAS